MVVTFVELGSIGEKWVVYFGAFRRQAVKTSPPQKKTAQLEQGRGRRGKNSGELNFELRHLIFFGPRYGTFLCHSSDT